MDVAVIDRFAKISQVVVSAALPFGHACELQIETCLTDKVQGDVGKRDVLLEDRAMPAPFGKAMTQDEPIVAEPQQVLEEVLRRDFRHSEALEPARNPVELRVTVDLLRARIEQRARELARRGSD